jgi:predicted transcriptional regulator
MSADRRSNLDIIADMLQAMQNSGGVIKPTHLMYKANLAHKRMKQYLEKLQENGAIKEVMIEGTKHYQITERGLQVLDEYNHMKKFMDSFGI